MVDFCYNLKLSIENTSAAKSPASPLELSVDSEVAPNTGGLLAASVDGLTASVDELTVASTPLALLFSASLANCIPLSMELFRLILELVSS